MNILSRIASKFEGLRQVFWFDNRWQLVFARAVFREPMNFYRYRDIVFLEDHAAGDANGARSLLTTPMYRRFLSKLTLPQEPSVLDLGASNGGFPLLLKALGFRPRRIVAVELNPNIFLRLRLKLEMNFDCPLTVMNAAVAGRTGSATVSIGPGSTGDSLYRPVPGGRSVTVPMITVDEILGNETFDIVKMDVEGAEYEIFSGQAYRQLAKCGALLIEIHSAYGSPWEIYQALGELGFGPVLNTKGNEEVHCFVRRERLGTANGDRSG